MKKIIFVFTLIFSILLLGSDDKKQENNKTAQEVEQLKNELNELKKELLKQKIADAKETLEKRKQEKAAKEKALMAEKRKKEYYSLIEKRGDQYKEILGKIEKKLNKRYNSGEFTEALYNETKAYKKAVDLFYNKRQFPKLPKISDLPKLYKGKIPLESNAKILSFQEIKDYIGKAQENNLYLKGRIIITKAEKENIFLAEEREYATAKMIPVVGIFVEATEAITEDKDIRFKMILPYKVPLKPSAIITLNEEFLPKISKIEQKDDYITATIHMQNYVEYRGTTYPDPKKWPPSDSK